MTEFTGLFLLLLAAMLFFIRLIDLVVTNWGMDADDDEED